MMRLTHFYCCASLLLVSLTTGCSIKHHIADDYGQYLRNNEGVAKFERANVADNYNLTPVTQSHHYEFRAVTVGYANLWIVEFGKILDVTMRSKDVVDALGSLSKVDDSQVGMSNTIVFDLDRYSFDEFGAHIDLTITVKNNGIEKFKRSYRSDGKTQGAKMFFTGVFGMKNAVQQSTKLALDEIIARFISDVKASLIKLDSGNLPPARHISARFLCQVFTGSRPQYRQVEGIENRSARRQWLCCDVSSESLGVNTISPVPGRAEQDIHTG